MSHDTCHMSGVGCPVSGVKCQVSGVRRQVSGVRCQVSGITCQVSGVTVFFPSIFLKYYLILIFLDKVVELVVGRSVINGAYPV